MRGSDGAFYVTKFQNNPQHTPILANELLASRIGLRLGLPVAPAEVIHIDDRLIQNTPELRFELAGHSVKIESGRHLGSRYVCDLWQDSLFDHLPETMFDRVKNRADFARVLVLDKWLGNCDGRQAVFSKKARGRRYTVTFIDHGYCFNAGDWSFPDLSLHGVYYRNFVYEGVSGWDAFEPALTQAEGLHPVDLWRCAESIPPEWYDHDPVTLEKLVDALFSRRLIIRDLITAFRNSSRNPFPNWSRTANYSLFSSPAADLICNNSSLA
jgi:hypothetical protein